MTVAKNPQYLRHLNSEKAPGEKIHKSFHECSLNKHGTAVANVGTRGGEGGRERLREREGNRERGRRRERRTSHVGRHRRSIE